MDPTLVDQIDAILPQTQCTQCGYMGCRPYAEAIASGQAHINQCPPGGQTGIHRLARLLNCAPLPLNPTHGVEKPLEVALIDESLCIGCTLCIQACPVDAIMGTTRRMHTVLPDACTGCALCVPPCPMDCIQMKPVIPIRDWTQQDANHARARMYARKTRLAQAAEDHRVRLEAKTVAKTVTDMQQHGTLAAQTSQKKSVINAALARARKRRALTGPSNQ